MKLSLGFSPCPNDTFIFDALVNRKIDTGEFQFEVILEDVETLNQWALQGKLDITKLSLPALFQSSDKYLVLNSGSALGKGVGPLLISKENKNYSSREVEESRIAIPGLHTTANLLLSFAFPGSNQRQPMLFSQIENAVLSAKADLGVIIHENRFTYQDKGLHKVVDLGEYWETKMKVPIPLGAIALKRKFESAADEINQLIRKSLQYAYAAYPQITDYVKLNSQEMDEGVMRMHIDLYVNNYSLDLGPDGRHAIETLQQVYEKMNSKTRESRSLFQ